MADFFGGDRLPPSVDAGDEVIDRFAQAIAAHNAGRSLLMTPAHGMQLSSPAPGYPKEMPSPAFNLAAPPAGRTPGSTPGTPFARMSLRSPPAKLTAAPTIPIAESSSSTSSQFTAVTHSDLQEILDSLNVMVIDIRPNSAYAAYRLPHALSLSVPSTLLKRPLFTLDKLSTMIASSVARSAFSRWSKASRILVYDADSTALPDTSNLLGLMRKFKNAGYDKDVCWLVGGIQGLWRHHRHFIDERPLNDDDDEGQEPAVLRATDLPMAAFRQSSTASATVQNLQPMKSPWRTDGVDPGATDDTRPRAAFGPQTSMRMVAANPFFDNIRQNIELSQGVSERIALVLPPEVRARAADLPMQWLRDLASGASIPSDLIIVEDEQHLKQQKRVDKSHDILTEALAMQFYRIELGEQRRLQGVMAHHSRPTNASDTDASKSFVPGMFPFSITAGVEKGSKNRYRNIWPFDHARVRLRKSASALVEDVETVGPSGAAETTEKMPPRADLFAAKRGQLDEGWSSPDDYVNASYVQPLGTRRQYIATQGPLQSTYNDFWTLVWEQDVRVIVMLTREFEGAVAKCGHYWSDGTYGPFTLKVVDLQNADVDERERQVNNRRFETSGGFDFYLPQEEAKREFSPGHEENLTIRRKFELSPTSQPGAAPRIIHHLQYLGWPDMNVPEDPHGVLRLVREVDELSDSIPGERPVLLHCSAGVGRTGGFIVIDAVLDGVRRAMKARAETTQLLASKLSHGQDPRIANSNALVHMDVDVPSSTKDMIVGPLQAESSAPSGIVAPLQLGGSELPSSMSTTAAASELSPGVKFSNSRDVLHIPAVPSSAPPGPIAEPMAVAPPRPQLAVPGTDGAVLPSRSDNTATTLRGPKFHPRRSLFPPASRFGTSSETDGIFTSTSTGALSPTATSIEVSFSPSSGSLQMDFTPAEADDMFTEEAQQAPFAMDVEPPSLQQEMLAAAQSASSGSGADIAAPRFASALSRGRLARAFAQARMIPEQRWRASGDDSDSVLGDRDSLRAGGSGSGSGSGSGADISSGQSSGMAAAGSYSVSPRSSSKRARRQVSPAKASFSLQPAAEIKERADESTNANRTRANLRPSLSQISQAVPQSQSSSSLRSFDSRSSSHHPSSETPPSLLFANSDVNLSDPAVQGVPQTLGRRPMKTLENASRVSASTSAAFDYKPPRELHVLGSPIELSTLKEPIRQVLEDLREQRMSLCQSLRQYVFVHRAVIEGALLLVDEERARLREESAVDADGSLAPANPASVESTDSLGKRGASPTELTKEDKKGEVALAKRQSMKRRAKSSSASSDSADFSPFSSS